MMIVGSTICHKTYVGWEFALTSSKISGLSFFYTGRGHTLIHTVLELRKNARASDQVTLLAAFGLLDY